MKKITVMGIILVLVCMFTLTDVLEAQKPINWRLQATSPKGTILVDKFAEVFSKLIEERSQGRLRIKVFPVAAIIPPLEVTASVGKGVVEMGQGGPPYDVGIIPLANVAAGLPFGWETAADQYEFWNVYKGGKALDMLNQAYHEKGVHNIILATFEDEYLALTKFPVNTLEDWKGKKMRATGVYGKVMAELGAATVRMSLPEVYMGIQTGTIDGAVVGFSLLEDFKLKEVVDYVIRPGFSSCAGTTLYVNLDKWNSLPADLQKIVNQSARDTYAETLMPYSVELRDKTYEEVRKRGIQVINLSDKETERLRQSATPVWKYIEGLSPRNAELMDFLREFLNYKGSPYPGK